MLVMQSFLLLRIRSGLIRRRWSILL